MPFTAPDLLRVAATVSVVLATVFHGWLGFALFFLVLGAVFVPRALGTPAPLDVAYCATLLLGAWAAQLDWYVAIGWLDVAVHAAATGLIALLAWQAMVHARALPGHVDPSMARPRLGSAVVTASMAVALAVVWEFGEWFGHTFLDERIQVGYADTIGDLAAGALGAVLAGVAVSRTPVAEPRR